MSKYTNVDKLLGALEFMKDEYPEDEWDKGWNTAIKRVIETVQKSETIEVEVPELTEDEIVILKNIIEYYNWIARSVDGQLCIYDEKPTRNEAYWDGDITQDFSCYSDLFETIAWESGKPYNIDELLALNGAKRNKEC